jgi:hypothetical protein
MINYANGKRLPNPWKILFFLKGTLCTNYMLLKFTLLLMTATLVMCDSFDKDLRGCVIGWKCGTLWRHHAELPHCAPAPLCCLYNAPSAPCTSPLCRTHGSVSSLCHARLGRSTVRSEVVWPVHIRVRSTRIGEVREGWESAFRSLMGFGAWMIK